MRAAVLDFRGDCVADRSAHNGSSISCTDWVRYTNQIIYNNSREVEEIRICCVRQIFMCFVLDWCEGCLRSVEHSLHWYLTIQFLLVRFILVSFFIWVLDFGTCTHIRQAHFRRQVDRRRDWPRRRKRKKNPDCCLFFLARGSCVCVSTENFRRKSKLFEIYTENSAEKSKVCVSVEQRSWMGMWENEKEITLLVVCQNKN